MIFQRLGLHILLINTTLTKHVLLVAVGASHALAMFRCDYWPGGGVAGDHCYYDSSTGPQTAIGPCREIGRMRGSCKITKKSMCFLFLTRIELGAST